MPHFAYAEFVAMLLLTGCCRTSALHTSVSPHSSLDPSPTNADTLCNVLGLASACQAVERDLEVMNRESARAELSGRTDKYPPKWTNGKGCMPKGQLIFSHVMKTGGTSISKFLECSCSADVGNPCGLQRQDGDLEMKQPWWRQRDNCPPSICTTHAPAAEAAFTCGVAFENAKTFTVLRDPVERVWSFYNSLRRWYLPYQQSSLAEILTNYKTQNPNDLVHPSEQCNFCHAQLSNIMTELNMRGPDDSLEEAKQTLRTLDLILDIDAVDRFAEIAAEKQLFPRNQVLSKVDNQLPCKMEKLNPSEDKLELDDKTRKLIEEHNAADIELYEYAKTLPNFVAK